MKVNILLRSIHYCELRKEIVLASRKAQNDSEKSKDPQNNTPQNNADNSGATSLFEEKKRTFQKKAAVPLKTVQALEKERQNAIDEGFRKLDELKDIDGSDRTQWLHEAGILTDMFRETRELFGGNRVSLCIQYIVRIY